MGTIYHVAKNGSDKNAGTAQAPFLTINNAAQIAQPGDTVMVHEGVYREYVNPKNAGLSNVRRIKYISAVPKKAVIKGSEEIKNWEKVEGTIWKVVLPNSMFGDFNPYKEVLKGDWLIYKSGVRHLGEVYLNGMSMYEAEEYKELIEITPRTEMYDHWTETIVKIKNVEQTKYMWFTQTNDETTTIYANFQQADPNKELVEINVRKSCFYPDKYGVNYITVDGFEMAHAATPWAPPTGDQPGLIGTHWSKGWEIINNVFHDAKCSAISIGKEEVTGDNYRTIRKDKPGYIYQKEAVFAAKKRGWSKEMIGSHLIKNNVIHDCGQNGIVGHLGCIFSEITKNHIYNIAIKREFYGHEIAGIKLHAAIDVHLHHNRIHDCSLGTWLDWQAQGTRVSKNIYYENSRDLFIEVTHGPHLVDNNILGSAYSLDNHAQGGAYVNNLFAGKIVLKKILDRETPYHTPHSTDITGYAMVYGGDDRFYHNIFLGELAKDEAGTAVYDGYKTSLEEYIEEIEKEDPLGDHEIFQKIQQPVYINENMYLGGAKHFVEEKVFVEEENFSSDYFIEEGKDGSVLLYLNLPSNFSSSVGQTVSTITLPRVRIVDADFEAFDGGVLEVNTDYDDETVEGKGYYGPFKKLIAGQNALKVW